MFVALKMAYAMQYVKVLIYVTCCFLVLAVKWRVHRRCGNDDTDKGFYGKGIVKITSDTNPKPNFVRVLLSP